MSRHHIREQPALFAADDGVLLDGALGRVTYTPDFLDAMQAGALFAQLRGQVHWRADRRVMYDRELDVPRGDSSLDFESVVRIPGRVEYRVEVTPLGADHFEPEHPLIITDMPRIHFDQQQMVALEAMGKDIGHMK